MSVFIRKSKTYLEQYEDFMKSEKTFTVKFYKEYEGEGGYWDYRDMWVSGETVREVVVEKTFSTIESALQFADMTQKTILDEEQTRRDELDKKYGGSTIEVYWQSEFNFKFNDPNNHQLIHAYINWGGSDYKMDLTYNIIER